LALFSGYAARTRRDEEKTSASKLSVMSHNWCENLSPMFC
jgi:hypothetical protein